VQQGKAQQLMKTRTFRGTAAVVLAIALVPTAFTQAQAAPAPTPGQRSGTPTSGLVSRVGKLPALKDATRKERAEAFLLQGMSPNTSSVIGAAAVFDMNGSYCPTGQVDNAFYGLESFEADLPFPSPEDSNGFTVATGPDAPDGTHWASSSFLASDPDSTHFVTSNLDTVPQTGRVFLSFSYRGQFTPGSAGVLINNSSVGLSPTGIWGTVALDITSEATTAGGTVFVGFGQDVDPGTATAFEVDDVAIYTCKTPVKPGPAPNSGVRGDWTGQGTVDLMATRSDGTLWAYEGKGTGTVGSGVQVGSGWSAFTWQGSPGDVNGDRRTDLLARRSDGTLWFYPGKGYGAFGSGLRVGSGWSAMTAIATPGDFDLDGRPDLVARRSDGTLHLYRIQATGSVRYVKQIGTGWNGMSSIVGMGDLNGDKRGDVVAIAGNGTMYSYVSSGSVLTGGKAVGSGWNAMSLRTSPGDMNKDGRGDLVARRSDGTLWFYPGRVGGGVVGGKQIGSGWQIMSNLL
jgi:FG-GAP-like repeat